MDGWNGIHTTASSAPFGPPDWEAIKKFGDEMRLRQELADASLIQAIREVSARHNLTNSWWSSRLMITDEEFCSTMHFQRPIPEWFWSRVRKLCDEHGGKPIVRCAIRNCSLPANMIVELAGDDAMNIEYKGMPVCDGCFGQMVASGKAITSRPLVEPAPADAARSPAAGRTPSPGPG